MQYLDELLQRYDIRHTGAKVIGGSTYVHRTNITHLRQALPTAYQFIQRHKLLDRYNPCFIKANATSVSMIKVDNAANFEPALISAITINMLSNKITERTYNNNPPIYHHVWLMYPEGTDLIDVSAHKLNSLWWRSYVGRDRDISSKIGRKDYWQKLLKSIPRPPKKNPQSASSKNTSINSQKLPAIYRMVSDHIEKGTKVVDIGAGKFDNVKQYISELGGVYIPSDPYNRTHSENLFADIVLDRGFADIAVCSNVLNVIDDDEELNRLTSRLCELVFCQRLTTLFFNIYEGNKTGVGKITRKDQYQRNQRTAHYVDLIKTIRPELTIRKVGTQIIVAK